MFGSHYFSQAYYGQGFAPLISVYLIETIRAKTRAISGFMRYTRRTF